MFEGKLVPGESAAPSWSAVGSSPPQARRGDTGRAYPLTTAGKDVEALGAELAATRALVRAESAAGVGAVVATLVHDLGGVLVPARDADPSAVHPFDVSLGLSEPMLPFADPSSVAAMRLSVVLPEFLEVARLVQSRLSGEVRRDEEATRDQLTGVLSRRAWMRRLSAAVPGDGVCLIDLDHFKAVNDTSGHAAGDAVLRAIGDLILRTFRVADSCGRYGGDEFVCLTPGFSAAGMEARCEQLRRAWDEERPVAGAGVGFSIGVAEVRERGGGRAALQAADAAMYRGKSAGRGRTLLAVPDDYGSGTPA